jgi:hypothetical protein
LALLRDLQEFRKKYAIIGQVKPMSAGKTNFATIGVSKYRRLSQLSCPPFSFYPQGKAKSGKVREDKKVLVTQAFLEDKLTTRYEGIVFDPSETCGKHYWNLWRGFKVQAKQGDISFLGLNFRLVQ